MSSGIKEQGAPLQVDLLSKGLTQTTRLIGVPINHVILNIGLFFIAGVASLLFGMPYYCFLIIIAAMIITHGILMILSVADDKQVDMLLVSAGLCAKEVGAKSTGSLSAYSPLQDTLAPSFSNEPGQFVKHWLFKALSHGEQSSARHVPYSHLHDSKTLVTKQGDLVQVIELVGKSTQTLPNERVDELKQVVNRLMYQMADPSLTIQSVITHYEDSSYPAGEFSNEYAKGLNERYRQVIDRETLYRSRLYLALIKKAPNLKKTGKKQAKADDKAEFTSALNTLNDYTKKALTMLEQFTPTQLATDEFTGKSLPKSDLLSFVYELINLEARKVPVPQQALDTYLPTKNHAFAKNRGIVELKGADNRSQFAAVLSIKEYPESSYAGLLGVVNRMGCELILSQSYQFLKTKKAIKELTRQQGFLIQAEAADSLIQTINESLDDLKAGRAAYGYQSLTVCVMAPSIDALNAAVGALESKLYEEAEVMLCRETRGVELGFWGMLPGNQRYLIRRGLINTLNLAGFSSFHNLPTGKIKGNHWGDAITTVETLTGSRYHLNLHVKEVGNSFACGPMGSGKTLVLAMVQVLMSKYKGWRLVFDKDRGMEVAIRALGGQYQIIKPGVLSGMAPLQMPDTPENRAFNQLLIEQLISTNRTLSDSEIQKIEKAIKGVYALEKSERTLANFAAFLGTSSPGSLRESFDRWHSEGKNAWVFDNANDSFEICNQVFGIDIGNLLVDEFSDVSTPILMYVFHRMGLLLDGSPTAVFIPEGWRFMDNPQFARQLDDWSRTPRKNNMCVLMDTQDPGKMSQSDVGASIARESRTLFFFANEKATPEEYSAFNLTDKEFEIIRDVLPSTDGHYFLLKHGQDSLIARFNLKGLDDDIAILSTKKASAKLLDLIRNKVGDAFENWHQPFITLNRIRLEQYADDFEAMEKAFESLWEKWL